MQSVQLYASLIPAFCKRLGNTIAGIFGWGKESICSIYVNIFFWRKCHSLHFILKVISQWEKMSLLLFSLLKKIKHFLLMFLPFKYQKFLSSLFCFVLFFPYNKAEKLKWDLSLELGLINLLLNLFSYFGYQLKCWKKPQTPKPECMACIT